jgi:hypothetical protein
MFKTQDPLGLCPIYITLDTLDALFETGTEYFSQYFSIPDFNLNMDER